MGSVNIMGTYSGIDATVVDQLIEAEKAKGVKFTNKKEKLEREKNAWKDINTRLDNLSKKLETLQKSKTFQTKAVTSTDTEGTTLSVSAGEDAATGQYRVQVTQLAQSSRMTGAKVSKNLSTGEALESIEDPLGLTNTTFTFTNHEGTDYTVSLTAEDSLKDVTIKINEQTEKSGIKASIVDNRLILTDTNMGERTIAVSGDAAAELGFSGSADEFSLGQAAVFTVDGLEITRNTNTIDDVIEGLTFELKNVHEGEQSDIITIEEDTEKTVTAVKEFVDQYNSTMSFITSQLDVGDPTAENNVAGALTGDGTVMRLQSGLRTLFSRNLEGGKSGDILSVEDIGITIDRYGSATLDEEKLKEALEKNLGDVTQFFYHQETVSVNETDEAGNEVSSSKIERTGLTQVLRDFVDTYISGTTGIITTKNESYDRMIKDLNEQIELFNDRIDRKRDRYIQQFTALDIAMMQAESQMSYMFSQLGMKQM
ncbi:flagellar filament capping protein FliD [Atopococcus tabaci]|uniref:flagellar filament capping protein FliD n=1 Tax=Atopococcus tabaci TaxID=269774 RepID=UPI0004029C96|nr:flagellar filament capping protein FliD [Atopococcus tabaci]